MSLTPREERGLRIARQEGHVVPRRSDLTEWNVKSQSRNRSYTVSLDPSGCNCPDFKERQLPCKHLLAVEYTLGRRTVPEETAVVRKTYSQNWPAYNAAQCSEKPRVIELLASLSEIVRKPPHHKGRPSLPLGDMVFAAVYRVYTGFSSRRFTSDLEEACKAGIIHRVPHFNSVTNYLSKTEMTSVLEQLVTLSSLPLRSIETTFSPDSSGFSTSRFLRWHSRKHGRETDNREWVKAHVLCGVRTNVVISAMVSGWSANDSPYFEPLLRRAAEARFGIREVVADKAYLSHRNVETVARLGGVPFIPFKTNTVEPRQDGSMWSRMRHFFRFNREVFLKHYHQRSNVETVFSMIKGKFGSSVRGRSFEAQANEVLCKVICHNLCVLVHVMFELGIRPDFVAELKRGETVIGENVQSNILLAD